LAALDDDSLAAVESMGLRGWNRAAVVCASTVFTAPIEWCAVLLGRGSEVVLKVPSAGPELGRPLAEAAKACDLPLVVTIDRQDIGNAEYVVAMGNDRSLLKIGASLRPEVVYEPHGHRFSAAWVGGSPLPHDPLVPREFSDAYGSIAADAALHDGRGCLSPVVVLTPDPDAVERLGAAMARAEHHWPRGSISDLEAASIRARGALAAAVGTVRRAEHWSVHALPAEHWRPVALPRSIAVVRVPSRTEAARVISPYSDALSTIGTDEPWADGPRQCRLGRMQRPALARHHDGIDWLRTTARIDR